jgi:hypothetical protein
LCPSTTTNLVGNRLTIRGDYRANTIQITDDGSGSISVALDGGAAHSFTGVQTIVVRSGKGADTVSYDLTGDRSNTLNLDVNLQQGNDTFNADLAAALLAGAKLAITVNGGNGNDRLNLTATNANVAAGADLEVALNGNNGKDRIAIDYQGNIHGTLGLRANGGNGQDFLAADMTGAIAFGGAATMAINGGNGKDVLFCTSSGVLQGQLNFDARGGNGPDTIAANLTADAGSTGSLKATLHSGNAKDDVTFLVHDDSGTPSTLTSLLAQLNTGHGHDTLMTTDNVVVI